MGYIAAQTGPGHTIFTPAPVKATKDMGPLAGDIDTVIRASRAGRTGNDIKVTVTGDAGSGVRITENGNTVTVLYETGVSTVANFETAIGTTGLLEVATAGTGATVLTAPGDDIAQFSLAGGVDLSPGVVLVSQHGVRLSGEGLNAGIVSDGTAEACIVCQYPPATGDGRAIDRLVVEDMTLDGNGYDTCISAAFSACRSLVVRRCVFRGATAIMVSKSGGELVVEDCDFYGTPSTVAVQVAQAVKATITGCRFFGGGGGVIASDDGYTKEIHTRNCTFEYDYWATPRSEGRTVASATASSLVLSSAPTAIIKLYDVIRVLSSLETGIAVDVDVDRVAISGLTHTPARWDRWEGPDGEWSQVVDLDDTYVYLAPWRRSGTWEPAETPGTVTAFRVTLGRSYTENAIATPLDTVAITYGTVGGWRTVEGLPAAVPAVSDRVDLIQRQTGHTDAGAIHYTDGAFRSTVVGCTVRGGYADMITVRGRDNFVTGCLVSMGQDMGYTIDPDEGYTITLSGCAADQCGVNCFYFGETGSAVAKGCHARNPGRVVAGYPGVSINGCALEWDDEAFNSVGESRRIDPSIHVVEYTAPA